MRQHLTFIFLSLILSLPAYSQQAGFKKDQLKYQRVRDAYSLKEAGFKKLLSQKGFDFNSFDLFIRIFKKEKSLQVWIKNKGDSKFTFLRDYDFCSFSGNLGPKRCRGDSQIPEGFYFINHFNPYSNFYLSLKINYPNKSDKHFCNCGNTGGDIFIHGNCVTIGCVPITDDKIMELYVLAVQAKNSGQDKINIHIFPSRMDDRNYSALKKKYSEKTDLLKFWENLKTGYDFFENGKKLPAINIKNGIYLFK